MSLIARIATSVSAYAVSRTSLAPGAGAFELLSWIALADVLGVIEMTLTREDLDGPINVVAPESVRNKEFTQALGRVLRRPAIVPAPAVALRAVFGEMADEALLSSARAEPSRLRALRYRFAFAGLESALRGALKA